MNELGRLIRETREAKGMSLRSLERKVGVSNAHLSQLETGRIEKPSMALLYLISEALDLDPKQLLQVSGHVEKRDIGGSNLLGVAFRGSDELTAEEADEVLRFIEMLKKRQA